MPIDSSRAGFKADSHVEGRSLSVRCSQSQADLVPREKSDSEDAKLHACRDGNQAPGDNPIAPAPTFAARQAAIQETAGALSGVYEPEDLRTLREDWPT